MKQATAAKAVKVKTTPSKRRLKLRTKLLGNPASALTNSATLERVVYRGSTQFVRVVVDTQECEWLSSYRAVAMTKEGNLQIDLGRLAGGVITMDLRGESRERITHLLATFRRKMALFQAQPEGL